MIVEHGTFTPLVFSMTGVEGPEAYMFHKHIAQKIFANTKVNYGRVFSLIRCKLYFLILISVLICVRGSRSVSNDHVHVDDVSLTTQAAGLFKFLWTLLSNLTLATCKVSLSLTNVDIGFVLLSIFPQCAFFLSFFYTASNNSQVS